MNISCISCPARYGVPDAKLAGKRVRITCKRCGTVLMVDGTVNPPRVSSGAGAGPSVQPVARTSLSPAPSSAASAAAPAAKVEFLVVMADDRQESADVAQIVRLYRDRLINAETLVWKDGMDEWKAVWDVADIAAAFRRMGYARPSQPSPSKPAQANYDDGIDDASTHVVPSSHPPAAAPMPGMFDEDEATSVVDSSRIALEAEQALASGAGWRKASEEDDDPTGVVPSPMELAMAPRAAARAVARQPSERPVQRVTQRSDRPAVAARRVEPTPSPEPAQARLARAQTREDSRARNQSLDIFAQQAHREAQQELAPAVEDDGSRLTGARGENSVLFSLDALIKQEQQAQKPLVLPPRARTDESVLVDSSPSLPSGVGGSALAAPDFTAPVSAPPPRMAAALGDDYPTPKRSKGWLIPVFLLLFVGAAGGAWMSGKLNPLLLAVGLPVGAPSAAPSAEPATSATPEASASEAASANEAASASPEASSAPTPSASASAARTGPVAAAGTSRATTPRETPTAKPTSETPEPKEEETKPAAAAGGAFDTASAKTALTQAANNAASCKEPGGPTGSGKVSITFAPSGRPTSVAVTGDLAGTTVGSCVARLFRAARVPAFSGDPVSVSKAFSVQ